GLLATRALGRSLEVCGAASSTAVVCPKRQPGVDKIIAANKPNSTRFIIILFADPPNFGIKNYASNWLARSWATYPHLPGRGKGEESARPTFIGLYVAVARSVEKNLVSFQIENTRPHYLFHLFREI